MQSHELVAGDALVVTDIQNDFLPLGSLAVARSDEVIAPLNMAIAEFQRRDLPIFMTRDWHPADHISFRARGGPWPPHCIAGTPGADFSPALKFPSDAHIVSKATERDHEAYSSFERTTFHRRLAAHGIKRLFIGGLTTDYCVLRTTLDARKLGYEVFVLSDAVRAINVLPTDELDALTQMAAAGAHSIRSASLVEAIELEKAG